MVDCIKEIWNLSPRPMGTHKPPANEVARRILAVIRYRGFKSQRAYAKRLGDSPQRLGNVIRGVPLSKDLGMKIVRSVPGLTRDWLWDGDARGMPGELIIEMERHLDAVEREAHHEAS